MIHSLPFTTSSRVADIGCGDGFYLGLFAESLGADGLIIAVDHNAEYLDTATSRIRKLSPACNVHFYRGDISALDRCTAACDLVWCAQSLMSFEDPVDALRRMGNIVRPGGMVAILENDSLHQLLLPWPSSLEIAIRAAEFQALAAETVPARYYIGRRLPATLAAAGLEPATCRTIAIDRAAPLGPDLKKFLLLHLQRLRDRIAPHLSRVLQSEFERLIDPTSDSCLLNQPHFTMTWLNVLAAARRPT